MKKLKIYLLFLTIIYLLLIIPIPSGGELNLAGAEQFIWNKDSLWNLLENNFDKYRNTDCINLENQIDSSLEQLNSRLTNISSGQYDPINLVFEKLLHDIFYTAPLIGACPDSSSAFLTLIDDMRSIVKEKSVEWDIDDKNVKSLLYKIIYGGRAAAEEIILQSEDESHFSNFNKFYELSLTPSTTFMGVKIHSGDILVSRGGAPTSALIARGSDYPGNFSHAALVYVDPETNIPFILESHIEMGVTVSTLEEYINDKKLRIMVLRIRNDLLELKNDQMLPHKAAKIMKDRADKEHIAYDFEMDYNNDDKLFCSEVVSSAYGKFNINLWERESTISSQGTADLLKEFGVRYFRTQEPSDIEFDTQLKVIAEWRDLETLYQDHVDNAAVDAKLEWFEYGNSIPSNYLILPIYRIVKLYSTILNLFNLVGPIPEGMSAEAALKHESYSTLHLDVKTHILKKAEVFKVEKDYRPPYWRLVEFGNDFFNNIY